MKKRRHQLILRLVEENEITTQEELLTCLREHGFDVTQATVSRDVKELRLVKMLGKNGQYRYAPHRDESSDGVSKFYSIFSDSVIGMECAQNICVIKCYAGMAQAVCASVDAMSIEGVVGTLAGDDTIFVLCKTNEKAEEFKVTVNSVLKG
ncbi:MAG: arginine repressor [Clostridiales bacterium]|nr:arginine repressor [Clostridiales bacterium]